MSDAAHYQANLAGETVPIHDAHPRTGFYRLKKHRNAAYLPVCIWEHEGEMVCRVGPDMHDVNAAWLQCADNPVSKADALFAFEHGRWPGDAPEPIRSNNPPSDDPFEEIARELQAEEARVNAWIAEPHEGKTAADMASNWLDALRALEAKALAAYDAEKAPVRAESQRIDSKWRGLKALAETLKRKMNDRFQAIGRKEKARLQAIADAKAIEDAERRRKEWEEEQAKKAALSAEHNIPLDLAQIPEIVAQAEPVKVAFGGAQGARNSVKALPPKAVVEDWPKAAVYFAGNAKLRELVQRLSDHAVKDGHAIPGVRIIPGG